MHTIEEARSGIILPVAELLRVPRPGGFHFVWQSARAFLYRTVGEQRGSRGRLRGRSLYLAPVLLAVGVLTIVPPGAVAQDNSFRGRVWSDDGIPVEGAAVRLFPVSDTAQVNITGTDRLGFFTFPSIATGAYILSIARIGYVPYREQIRVPVGARTATEVTLLSQAVELEGFLVEAQRSRARARFEESAGMTVQELDRKALRAVPGLIEVDPIRAVEVLPGVTTVSDFSAAFNVRGGSADQNLILLDDVPVFSPFHLGGFFSVFNADMVERAELRSGGFPAEYGGRVSSVLVVESDAGDGKIGADAGVSLLASRLAVKGSLPGRVAEGLGLASARWRVSGRRSYVDVIADAVPYNLTDFQAVFEGWTRGGNRLKVSAYTGRDVVDFTDAEGGSIPLQFRWDWGNDAVGGSWTSPMTGGGALDLQASFSRFHSDFGFANFAETDFSTKIEQATFRADLERRPTPRVRWTSGLVANRLGYDNRFQVGGTVFGEGDGRGWETAAYTQLHWDASVRWLVEGGLRLDHWRPAAAGSQTTVSPRFAIKRFVRDRRSALRLAGGRYSQFVQSRRDEELPFGLDVWVLAGPRAPRLLSDQVQVGAESFFGAEEEWFASAEGYFRTFDGVIGENAVEEPGDPLDDLVAGTGQAYGVDLFLKRDLGTTTGWISASFLKTDRTFPDTRSGLDPVPLATYPPVFDRRFEVDLVVQRQMGWWGLDGGLRFNFGTGLPYTRPLGAFDFYRRRNGVLQREAEPAVVLGPRNGARYPSRHRLDISFRKPMEKKWGRLTPYASIINVYNKKNVLFYFFEYDRTPPVRTGVSMIPFLPTVGVEISFQ